MFTGIVEGLGKVVRMQSSGDAAQLVVDLGPIAGGVSPGDSVALDGACLTAANISGKTITFDVSRETLSRTAIGHLRPGAQVNLERALRAGDRLGGHFVLGHVDGVGAIAAITPSSGQVTLKLAASPEIIARLVPKGSIAVSGISLTIAAITADSFSIAIIPHTMKNTNLPARSPGDKVNLELDIIGKYVERLLALREGREPPPISGITTDFLAEHGFK